MVIFANVFIDVERSESMKIAVGAILCEGNSLTPILTRFKDFDYAQDHEMLKKLPIMDMLEEKNCEVVPTIYAHALPGGAMVYGEFVELLDNLLSRLPDNGLDGVWLYLHGAMCVEKIGSAEEYILRKVREKVGYKIPVSVALDFHADNSDEIPKLCNCVTGYRTAPHRDHDKAQRHALELLFNCIEKGILPSPQLARANVIVWPDAVQTDLEPLKSIMERAEQMQEYDGMMSVQVFNGQAWIDESYTGPSFVVTHEYDTELAKKCADELAKMYYEKRHDFKFLIETYEPIEAIEKAVNGKEELIFISDSGDNTTAGAAGDNAYMLNRVIESGAKNVLIAGICDAEACLKCYEARIGDTLTLNVGGSLCGTSESSKITGKLIHTGDILSYQHNNAGKSATLDCGDFTIVVTENRAALCRPDIFESIDLDYKKFHIVVVKLGYLFPELAQVAERSILAFTPGTSCERLEDMGLKKIRRPMFPLDDE